MKNIVFLIFFLSVVACHNSPAKRAGDANVSSHWPMDSLPSIEVWQPTDSSWVSKTEGFTNFSNRLKDLNAVTSDPDLKMLIEELIEKERILETDTKEAPFDKPEVMSRLLVIRTFLGEIQANIENEQELRKPIQSLMEANNALQNQLSLQVKLEEAPQFQTDEIE